MVSKKYLNMIQQSGMSSVHQGSLAVTCFLFIVKADCMVVFMHDVYNILPVIFDCLFLLVYQKVCI